MENLNSNTSNSSSTEDQATIKILNHPEAKTASLQDALIKIKNWFNDFIPKPKKDLITQPLCNSSPKLEISKEIPLEDSSSFQSIIQQINLLYDNIEKQEQKINSLIEHIENHEKFQFHTIERLSQHLNKNNSSELKTIHKPNQSIEISTEANKNSIVWPINKTEINAKGTKSSQALAESVIKCVHQIHNELFKNLNSFFRSRCKKYSEIRELSNFRASYYNLIVDRTLRWLEIPQENWFDICKRKEFIQKCINNPVLLEVGDYLLKFNKDAEICKQKLGNYIKKMKKLENVYVERSDKICTFCGFHGHDRRSCKEMKKVFCKKCLDYNSHTTKYHSYLYGS